MKIERPLKAAVCAGAGRTVVDGGDPRVREDRGIHPVLHSGFFGITAGDRGDRLAHGTRDR